MGKNKVNVDLGIENAESKLDALINKARQLSEELRRAGSVLGTDPTDRNAAHFFGTAERLSTVQGAISAEATVRGSAGIGGASGAAAFGQAPRLSMREISDPGAALGFIQGISGLSAATREAAAAQIFSGRIPTTGAFDPNAYIDSVLSSARPTLTGALHGPPPPPVGAFSLVGVGAANNLADPGNGRWRQVFSSQDARLGQMGGTALAIGASATVALATQNLDIQTAAMLGHRTALSDAVGNTAGAFGAVVGGSIGFLAGGGPIGAALGAAGVGAAFSSVARWAAAPLENRLNTTMNLLPFSVAAGATPYGAASPPGVSPRSRAMRLETMADEINRSGAGRGDALNPMRVTSAQLAETWGGVAEALTSGGIDPFARSDSGHVYIPNQLPITGGPGRPSTETAINTIKQLGFGREQVGEMYTRRLATLYGGELAPQMEKRVGPIFATLPETGGNIADILGQFGPTDTERYLRIQHENLRADVDLPTLRRVSAETRGANRAAAIGATQARGSGAAQEAAFDTALQSVSSLPDGANSLEAAQLRVKRRSAREVRFDQEDIVNYGLKQTTLQGQLDRLDVSPFAPGSRLLLMGQVAQNNRNQIGVLQNRLTGLRGRGDLTEEAEQNLTSRIEGLKTQNASLEYNMIEDLPNRLPGLTAGRPGGAGFRRLNTQDLVAIQMDRSGIPYRGAGAPNGAALKRQDDVLRSLSSDGVDFQGHSRTAGLNNLPGGGDEETKAILRDIANLLRQNLGGGRGGNQRPGENRASDGGTTQRNIFPGPGWVEVGRSAN